MGNSSSSNNDFLTLSGLIEHLHDADYIQSNYEELMKRSEQAGDTPTSLYFPTAQSSPAQFATTDRLHSKLEQLSRDFSMVNLRENHLELEKLIRMFLSASDLATFEQKQASSGSRSDTPSFGRRFGLSQPSASQLRQSEMKAPRSSNSSFARWDEPPPPSGGFGSSRWGDSDRNRYSSGIQFLDHGGNLFGADSPSRPPIPPSGSSYSGFEYY